MTSAKSKAQSAKSKEQTPTETGMTYGTSSGLASRVFFALCALLFALAAFR